MDGVRLRRSSHIDAFRVLVPELRHRVLESLEASNFFWGDSY